MSGSSGNQPVSGSMAESDSVSSRVARFNPATTPTTIGVPFALKGKLVSYWSSPAGMAIVLLANVISVNWSESRSRSSSSRSVTVISRAGAVASDLFSKRIWYARALSEVTYAGSP